ncbi:substrate binding domain-containing protein [Roseovarius sp. S4756]|uniref:substrate binding domain-containing protein n=1 Tax=Roseovarius maritimus TaxID=3342637 RepID=UPI0037265981
MDHISRIGVFVAVVEAGGFAGAARALQDLREAEELINELKSRPKGPLRISLPQSFGIKYLGTAIAEFAARYPEVELDVSLNERFVDMASEGVDLAVRIGALADTSLIARRMAGCPFVLCASAGYLAEHGTPERPEDLADHNVLAFTGNSGVHEWRYLDAAGSAGQISLRASFRTDSGDMLCSAALAGVGIAILPIFYVAAHLETGALRAILPEYTTAPQRDIFAVFPPSRFQSTRLRLLVEHLVGTCRDLPWER